MGFVGETVERIEASKSDDASSKISIAGDGDDCFFSLGAAVKALAKCARSISLCCGLDGIFGDFERAVMTGFSSVENFFFATCRDLLAVVCSLKDLLENNSFNSVTFLCASLESSGVFSRLALRLPLSLLLLSLLVLLLRILEATGFLPQNVVSS